MSTPVPELRAKRTHARRSCDVCKIRKTRCELPDLDVPSSQTPLALDKACHRCRILSIPCIVDDSGKKPRKRITIAEYTGGPTGVKPKRARTSASSSSKAQTSQTANIDHTLDILHGFNPLENSPTWTLADAAAGNGTDTGSMPPYSGADAGGNHQAKSMKLHGRPLELVCAMLSVAYGKRSMKRAGVEEAFDVDLEVLVNHEMRSRLEPGVARLRTFHPYLETLPFLFNNYTSDPSTPATLLLSLVLYLSSLALPTDEALSSLRSTLTPLITVLRDDVLLSLPQSFIAIQALDILAVHAPLGILPAQKTNPRALAVARGQIAAAMQIAAALNFSAMVRSLTHVSRIEGLQGHMAWETTDNWLWLAMCVNEAAICLEDVQTKKPESLAEARGMVDEFWRDDYSEVWSVGLHVLSPPELVGRLAICDRIARLSEVIDSAVRLRSALDSAAMDPSLDIVEALVGEMKYLTERLDGIDAKHDAIIHILSPSSGGVEAGWLAYRSLRRRYEAGKLYSTGLRCLMATVYLPGSPLAFSGLPTNMPPFQRVSYALARAANPADMVPFLVLNNNPAVQAVWTWGKHRMAVCESTLAAFAEIGRGLVEGKQRIILPLHDTLCIAVESAKLLMEMQAGTIMIPRTPEEMALPRWVDVLHQVCDIMRSLAALSSPTPKSAPAGTSGNGGTSTTNVIPHESLSSGCGSLIGSMIRLANEWARSTQQAAGEKEGAFTMPKTEASDGTISGPPTGEALSAPVEEGGAAGFAEAAQHPYMNSSDRWMASDHPGPPAGSDQTDGDRANNPNGYGPTATPLDLLLSHMFNYSYRPPGGGGDGTQQQQQQQQHQQHTSDQHNHQHGVQAPPPPQQQHAGHGMEVHQHQMQHTHSGHGEHHAQDGSSGWPGDHGGPVMAAYNDLGAR